MVAGNMRPKTKAFRSLSVVDQSLTRDTIMKIWNLQLVNPFFLVDAVLGFFRWFSTHSFIFQENCKIVIVGIYQADLTSPITSNDSNVIFLAVSGSLSFIPGLRDVLLGLCPRFWSHAQCPCEKCSGAEGWRHSCQAGHEATGEINTRELHSQRAGIADIDKASKENVLGEV